MVTQLVLSTLALAVAAPAQGNQPFVRLGSGGFGQGSAYVNQFNPNSIITFEGRVTGIQVGSPVAGLGDITTLLVLAPNGGTAHVEAGPAWYLDQLAPPIETGDWVTIRGSKILRDGRGVIFPTEIRVENQILELRELGGAPYWAMDRVLPPIQDPLPLDQTVVATPPFPGEEVIGDRTQVLVDRFAPTMAFRNGAIEGFLLWTPPRTQTPHVVMVLDTGVSILLGPLWYMQRQDVALNVGDLVQVTTMKPFGSELEYATNVSTQEQQLVLRSVSEVPVWVGWRPFLG